MKVTWGAAFKLVGGGLAALCSWYVFNLLDRFDEQTGLTKDPVGQVNAVVEFFAFTGEPWFLALVAAVAGLLVGILATSYWLRRPQAVGFYAETYELREKIEEAFSFSKELRVDSAQATRKFWELQPLIAAYTFSARKAGFKTPTLSRYDHFELKFMLHYLRQIEPVLAKSLYSDARALAKAKSLEVQGVLDDREKELAQKDQR